MVKSFKKLGSKLGSFAKDKYDDFTIKKPAELSEYVQTHDCEGCARKRAAYDKEMQAYEFYTARKADRKGGK